MATGDTERIQSRRLSDIGATTIVPIDLTLLSPSSSFEGELDGVENNSTVDALRAHCKELDSLISEMGVGISPRSLLVENEDEEFLAEQYSIARAESVLRKELEAAEQFMKGIKNEIFDEERDSDTSRKQELFYTAEETREDLPISSFATSLCGVDWTDAECWSHVATREIHADCNDSVDKLPNHNQVDDVQNESSEQAVRHMPPSVQVATTQPRSALLSVLLSWSDSTDSLLLSPETVIDERKAPHSSTENHTSAVGKFEFYDSLCTVLSPRCLETLESTFSEDSDDGLPFLRNERLSTISERTDSQLSSRVRLLEPCVDLPATDVPEPRHKVPRTEPARQMPYSFNKDTPGETPKCIDTKAGDPTFATNSNEMTQNPIPNTGKEMHQFDVEQKPIVVDIKAIPSLFSSNSTSTAEPCLDETDGVVTPTDQVSRFESVPLPAKLSVSENNKVAMNGNMTTSGMRKASQELSNERKLSESTDLRSLNGGRGNYFPDKSLENLENQMETYKELLDILKGHLEHTRSVKSSPSMRQLSGNEAHGVALPCASDRNSTNSRALRLCLSSELDVGQTFGEVQTPARRGSTDQVSPLSSFQSQMDKASSGSDEDFAGPDPRGTLTSHTSLESLLRRKSDSVELATDTRAHDALDEILAESSVEKSLQPSNICHPMNVTEAIVDTNTSIGVEVVHEALANAVSYDRSLNCENGCSTMQTLAKIYTRNQMRKGVKAQKPPMLPEPPINESRSGPSFFERVSRYTAERNNGECDHILEPCVIDANSEDASISNSSTETKPATFGWRGCCSMPCALEDKSRREDGGGIKPETRDGNESLDTSTMQTKMEERPDTSYSYIFQQEFDQNGVEVVFTEPCESDNDSLCINNFDDSAGCVFDVVKPPMLERRDRNHQKLANEDGVEGTVMTEETERHEISPSPATPSSPNCPIVARRPNGLYNRTEQSATDEYNDLARSRGRELEREYLEIPRMPVSDSRETKTCLRRQPCPRLRPEAVETRQSADEVEQSQEQTQGCEARQAQVREEVRQLEDTAEIIKATEKLLRAIVGYNFTMYKELVTCDITGVDKGSLEEVVSQKKFLSYHFRHARNQCMKGRVALEKPVVRFLTQDVAIISYVRIDSMREEPDDLFKCTESRVWERRHGQWVNSHYHTSL